MIFVYLSVGRLTLLNSLHSLDELKIWSIKQYQF